MKLFPQLAIATSLVLSLAILSTKSVSAAIVNYAFSVDSSTAKGNGLFSFDDSTFSNDNIPVAPLQALTFQFDNDPNIYTAKDDIEYPDYPVTFPTVSLADNASIGLLYNFLDKVNPSKSYEIAGTLFSVSSETPDSGTVSYREVPEPSTLDSTLLVGGIGLFLNRKLRSIKKIKA
ncbi:PEP-CTERM sorting domain-containing protein [Nostoc muscorum FACHB-395]|uniref:PEP-CTERM sorting domain-containing protein n=1 Tax=Nostoc sp. C057 TaxID=2576903 RepID=UPI0015C3D384|nr:PEP-CTERM sorting domain-containing protein [Nostoc sp. C057]MBD2511549.1 PEP-CTERM sorting domain-containing protein [Desmonostoc muscorum FACHB-395]QLE47750.1 PEP-CTERM sorting domain-containing protein [Nostoc sp. C057]